MALTFLFRKRTEPPSFAPDPFPVEPDPEALLPTTEEPNEVLGDEGGGGISAPGSHRSQWRLGRKANRTGDATGRAG